MGIYVNPGNQAFKRIDGPNYVDKTGMIRLFNETIGGEDSLVCISRPRRFGKSYSAKMLSAYYDCSCDSHDLFDNKVVSKCKSYEEHINKYNVICLDISGFISVARREKVSLADVPSWIAKAIKEEILVLDPEAPRDKSLENCLVHCVERPNGRQFIFIIDEWDAPIRENPSVQEDYLEFLRSLFKNSGTTSKIVAAAYMTGILPIKKDGSQSPLSEFREYTMIKPRKYGEYVGFTEKEVKDLCDEHEISLDSMKHWYDGYDFKGVGPIYNPNSVMLAIENDDFDSYWTESSAAEGLMKFISKPYNGLTKTIAELIGGVDVKVDTKGFANDLVTFRGRDDVLTLMIHLGYLAYDSEKGTVHIPNEEIKLEFQKAIREVDHEATLERLNESSKLFLDTITGNEEAVAAQIEKIHREETSPLHYNKEDSLRSVIKLAYYTYRDNYLQWEELPAGDGYADVVYLPKHDSDWPVLLIELKWNKSAAGAIDQILAKHYPEVLKDYGSDIMLVGINYDKDSPSGEKKHTCKITKYQME